MLSPVQIHIHLLSLNNQLLGREKRNLTTTYCGKNLTISHNVRFKENPEFLCQTCG